MNNPVFEIIAMVIGSGTTGGLITSFFNKGRNKAEAQSIIGQAYGDLIDELRQSISFQGEQIKGLQEREVQYLKIINGHQEIERELRQQIKSLETKLAKRIHKLEQES